jgi:hypothetical protein
MEVSRLRLPTWLGLLFFSALAQLSVMCLAQSTTDARKTSSSIMTTATSVEADFTSSTAAATLTVQVGLADHKFKPEVTEADIGDVSFAEFSEIRVFGCDS